MKVFHPQHGVGAIPSPQTWKASRRGFKRQVFITIDDSTKQPVTFFKAEFDLQDVPEALSGVNQVLRLDRRRLFFQ